MSTLRDLVEEHSALSADDLDHLHRLAGDWQLLSDLSFADLLLWVPAVDEGFLCVAQVRPTTAPTAHLDDQVGRLVTGSKAAHLHTAVAERRIWREGDPVWHAGVPARHEAIPVRRANRVVGVVGRDTNLAATRVPSQLELNYLQVADDLCRMIADGSFPLAQLPPETTSAPRVGDGLVRLDRAGRVSYASPNAQSAYRRLGLSGDLLDSGLASLTRSLSDDPLDGGEAAERIEMALRGEAPAHKEVEARGATVLLRALPLLPEGRPIGAVVLVRDVTDVRRRDRALLSKDATIREIHHRVKNNLQTVAALLRLQARRVATADARAALEESVRRVSTIALVHETLALSMDETVEFDTIVDRVSSMVGEVAAPESHVTQRREGSFGVLPAQVATPLVMVVTELLQNAVEHAYGPGEAGEVVLAAHRWRGRLHVRVSDSGQGLPPDFSLEDSQRLGLQIVWTLVTGELGGTLEVLPRAAGGTEVVLVVPLTPSR
ncbi:MAG TPA: histidine kinase N-terminal domain-containing protein [Cryptosporangiaceae bacterium]|nr:histidine kinase N-terminal domain-containing protein [Cryptosporangiaceae bacterium]